MFKFASVILPIIVFKSQVWGKLKKKKKASTGKQHYIL